MEETLPEMLREYARFNLKRLSNQFNFFGIPEGYDNMYDWLADEIERCYIPRPRFEDGEPVQFGDDIEIYDRSGLLDKGIIQSFHPNKGTVWMLSLVGCDHERLVRFDPETCVIKRPAPKVLDADGVPYEKGQTVWRIRDGKEGNVVEVEMSDHPVCVDFGNDELVWCSSDILTHEKPVFDADGVRICKGDTVYLIGHGNTARTVEEVVTDKPTPMGEIDSPWVKFVSNYNSWDFPSAITHREPDSLERIKADRELTICEYNAKYQDAVTIGMENHILDRAIALIERGA